jgi:hypothetical protein
MEIKQIIEFVKGKADYLKTAEKLYNIYNQQLYPYVKERIMESLESQAGIRESLSRACCINILPKIVNKLSNVYTVPVERSYVNQDAFTAFLTRTGFEDAMSLANRYLNLHRTVAIEPVFSGDGQVSKIRVIPANKFLVMDDGTIDGNMVAFIKIINDKVIQVYTEQEFFFINLETDAVSEVTPNEYGIIPAYVIVRDCVTTMPPEDKDTYEMVTLLPLLLTDLNYALKFQCFSIIYTIDVDPSKVIMAPNAVWPLQTLEAGMDEAKKPTIGTIEPKVRTQDLLDALFTQYSLWLESRSIKMGSFDRSSGSQGSLSGIAKAIDNADVEADMAYQRKLFERAEMGVFALLNAIGKDIVAPVTSRFHVPNLIQETRMETVDRVIKELGAGLTTREAAIRAVHPGYSDDEVAATLAEGVEDVGTGDNSSPEDTRAE